MFGYNPNCTFTIEDKFGKINGLLQQDEHKNFFRFIAVTIFISVIAKGSVKLEGDKFSYLFTFANGWAFNLG